MENTNNCNLKCEVYTRIVGYYRPKSNANPGKQEEIRLRKNFDIQKAVSDVPFLNKNVMEKDPC